MMDSDSTHTDEYSDEIVARVQFKWGEGFLSPGGADEVAAMLSNASVRGLNVLDLGCGLGGGDLLLVKEHGASRVVGIDIEKPLLQRATELIRSAGCDEQIEFRLVEPGRLPFDNETFDVVFSKDAMIHIPGKITLYADVHRVLRSGGLFVASDWYKAPGPCPDLVDFMERGMGMTVDLQTLEDARGQLTEAGFVDVRVTDRHDWFRAVAEHDLEELKGRRNREYIEAFGEQSAQRGVELNEWMVSILQRGELRPGHIQAKRAS